MRHLIFSSVSPAGNRHDASYGRLGSPLSRRSIGCSKLQRQERENRRCGWWGTGSSTGNNQLDQGFSRLCNAMRRDGSDQLPFSEFSRSRLFFATSTATTPHIGLRTSRLTLRNATAIRNLSRFPQPSGLFCHEKDLSTKSSSAQTTSRLPTSNAYPSRSRDDQGPASKGTEATRCLATTPYVAETNSVEFSTAVTADALEESSSLRHPVFPVPLDWGSSSRNDAETRSDAIASNVGSGPPRTRYNSNQEMTT